MTKLTALLVLLAASLATCQPTWFGWYVGVLNKPVGSRPPDFSALEDFLATKLASNDYSSENIALIEANINKFGDTGLRSAAKLLVDLSKVDGQCDGHVLELIHRLQVAGLRLGGATRTEKVAEGQLRGALEACQQYIAQEVEQSAEAPQSMANLTRIVRPRETPQSIETLGDATLEDVIEFVAGLSETHSKAQYLEMTASGKVAIHKSRFSYDFDKYLTWPCHQWTDQVAEQFAAADMISAIQQGSNSSPFQGRRFATFRRLAWTRHACKYVLQMNRQTKADLLDALRKEWAL